MKRVWLISRLTQRDVAFIIIYLLIQVLLLFPLLSLTQVEFCRGLEILEQNSENSLKLISWAINMLLPILYLTFDFTRYFEASFYYFSRVKNREKWLRLMNMRYLVFLLIIQVLKTVEIVLFFDMKMVLNLEMILIFIRDYMYMVVLWFFYLGSLLYLGSQKTLVIATVLYFVVLLLGISFKFNFVVLYGFNIIELGMYLLLIGVLYVLCAMRIRNSFDKICLN